ncbi:unnamed protein product [Linum tenue]|uniref:Uncharacterized protein n=1 Tax=Linum tenue TaxID=586396 RepID=A0AAV0GX78_9ROSI|nr:unnamed protein product [Linum tenue]
MTFTPAAAFSVVDIASPPGADGRVTERDGDVKQSRLTSGKADGSFSQAPRLDELQRIDVLLLAQSDASFRLLSLKS